MPKKLLLADDSLTIEKIVRLTFADEGVEIQAATDGESALALIESYAPDIILADVFMPGPNGYEISAAVKDNPDLAHIPVVLLVGAFEQFDASAAEKARCDASLTKPFDTNELVKTVRHLLGGPEMTEIPTGESSEALRRSETGQKPCLVSSRTKKSFLGADSILDLFGAARAPYLTECAEPNRTPTNAGPRAFQVIPFPGTRAGDAEQPPAQLSEAVIDLIVQRVVRQLSQEVIREIAWEVVPELSKSMIRQVLSEQSDPDQG